MKNSSQAWHGMTHIADAPHVVATGCEVTTTKLNAFLKRRGAQQFVSQSQDKTRRDFMLWQKVRAGRITDLTTLATIAGDQALKSKFAEWDRQAAQLSPQ